MRILIAAAMLLLYSTAVHAEETRAQVEARWSQLMPYLLAGQDEPRRYYILNFDRRWPLSEQQPEAVTEADFFHHINGGGFPASAADVILIGEQHDDPATHRIEWDFMRSIRPGPRPVAEPYLCVGMEMFERDVQSFLDAYITSRDFGPERVPEATFLAHARPWGNYMADYRPIVEWFRMYGAPQVFGTNTPTPLARRVAKEGLDNTLKSLTPEERGWVAETTTSPKDEYWQRFLEAMGGGASADAHSMGMSEEQIYGFYQAQCLKDDTMAETIARLREADPQRQVVHLSGSFHIDYHLGIYPRLVQRRPQDTVVTVAIRPVADFREATLQEALAAEPGVADYVIFVLREEPVAAP
jgi:uncharacterized iron-regulated protein